MRNLKTSLWISCAVHLAVLTAIALFATSFQQEPQLESGPLIELVSPPIETPPQLVKTMTPVEKPAPDVIPARIVAKVEEPKPVTKIEEPKPRLAETRPAVATVTPVITRTVEAPEPERQTFVSGSSSVTPLSTEPLNLLPSSEGVPSPGVTAQPRYRDNPTPTYPSAAQRQRQEGTVVLSVFVTASGKPENVQIKESSGFASLDVAAKNAVRNWKFDPARSDDQPVASKVEVPVTFQLSK